MPHAVRVRQSHHARHAHPSWHGAALFTTAVHLEEGVALLQGVCVRLASHGEVGGHNLAKLHRGLSPEKSGG